jgi:Lrp/AsnC family transcriptional regulator, leucine-responsive regulatory protein
MRIRKDASVAPGLDDLDSKIIGILRSNGRATNQEIAKKLAVSAPTVSARIRKLEESKALRVVAVTDYSAHGFDLLVAIGVTVNGRPARDVGRDLAKLHEVLSIQTTTGPSDLEMLVGVRDLEHLNAFLTKTAPAVGGIAELQSGIATDILKYDFNVVRL